MGFERELELAKDLARRAGLEILEYYAREIIAEEKLGVDLHSEPVTAADRAASRLIVAGIETVFPEDAILSEEDVPPKVVNLMEALKKSVAEVGSRKMAPSVKPAAAEEKPAEEAPARRKRTRKTG